MYYCYRTHYGKALQWCLRLDYVEMVFVFVARQISDVGLAGGF